MKTNESEKKSPAIVLAETLICMIVGALFGLMFALHL